MTEHFVREQSHRIERVIACLLPRSLLRQDTSHKLLQSANRLEETGSQ